ncbi:MAG: aldo/keto reductase [Armatimonadota bacterium]|nr:MAG: aldo/keto reductase [Armatimonadota bacterium]
MGETQLTRRDFLRAAFGTAAATLLGATGAAHVFDAPFAGVTELTRGRQTTLPTRILGRTGERVSMLALGGDNGLHDPEPAGQAEAIINAALEHGITYFDSAREYNFGEVHYGRHLGTRRKKVFLTTKVHARPYDDAWRSVETSLRNLQTDYVDLLQIHHVQDLDDADRVTAKDGSLKAAIEAREQGLARYLGVTGHRDPQALAEMLRRFDFDTILMPMNAADVHHLPFQGQLIDTALERKMGIINMKVLARGALLQGDNAITMQEAVNYALTLPVTTAVVGFMNAGQIPRLVEAVRGFRQLSADEITALVERTKPFARTANFFKRDSDAPWPP